MTIQNAKTASKLIDEIESLSKYKNLLEDREHGKNVHFNIVQHWGRDSHKVEFSSVYTEDFIPVVELIINRLKMQLELL